MFSRFEVTRGDSNRSLKNYGFLYDTMLWLLFKFSLQTLQQMLDQGKVLLLLLPFKSFTSDTTQYVGAEKFVVIFFHPQNYQLA